MTGYRLARLLDPAQVTVNALHPGLVATPIIDDITPPFALPFRSLIRRALLTPAEGAAATLRLATHPDLDGVTGRYLERDVERRSPDISYDHALQERVWAASIRLTSADPR